MLQNLQTWTSKVHPSKVCGECVLPLSIWFHLDFSQVRDCILLLLLLLFLSYDFSSFCWFCNVMMISLAMLFLTFLVETLSTMSISKDRLLFSVPWEGEIYLGCTCRETGNLQNLIATFGSRGWEILGMSTLLQRRSKMKKKNHSEIW